MALQLSNEVKALLDGANSAQLATLMSARASGADLQEAGALLGTSQLFGTSARFHHPPPRAWNKAAVSS
jgi:hypothetical protein